MQKIVILLVTIGLIFGLLGWMSSIENSKNIEIARKELRVSELKDELVMIEKYETMLQEKMLKVEGKKPNSYMNDIFYKEYQSKALLLNSRINSLETEIEGLNKIK